MKDILIATAAIFLPALLIFALEYRSRPRDTPKAAGLRAANRDGKGEGK